jgi:hypothetical protein
MLTGRFFYSFALSIGRFPSCVSIKWIAMAQPSLAGRPVGDRDPTGERERNGGAVSPIPTLTPISDFMEQLKVAGQHAKPYQILGQLGKGKFAMVYVSETTI